MDSEIVGIKEDDHVEDYHGAEETFHPSRYMDSANVGSDNNTNDYTDKDIREAVEFVDFLHFLHDGGAEGKTDDEYNVNGDNSMDSDYDVKESKDTSVRGTTQEYFYKDYNFFDRRTKAEKKMKRRGTEYVSQNQLFFYQQYRTKVENEHDNTGGFRSLVARTKAHNQQDTIKMAEKGETKTMFHLYRFDMGLTTLQRKHMCDLFKSMDEEQGMV
jgi:hypothetical protein